MQISSVSNNSWSNNLANSNVAKSNSNNKNNNDKNTGIDSLIANSRKVIQNLKDEKINLKTQIGTLKETLVKNKNESTGLPLDSSEVQSINDQIKQLQEAIQNIETQIQQEEINQKNLEAQKAQEKSQENNQNNNKNSDNASGNSATSSTTSSDTSKIDKEQVMNSSLISADANIDQLNQLASIKSNLKKQAVNFDRELKIDSQKTFANTDYQKAALESINSKIIHVEGYINNKLNDANQPLENNQETASENTTNKNNKSKGLHSLDETKKADDTSASKDEDEKKSKDKKETPPGSYVNGLI